MMNKLLRSLFATMGLAVIVVSIIGFIISLILCITIILLPFGMGLLVLDIMLFIFGLALLLIGAGG